MKKIIIFCCSILAVCILQAQQDNKEEIRKYIRRAQTAYNAGELNDALEEYKLAQKLAPQYPELYKAMGDVYEKLGGTSNLAEAIIYYKRYLELAPNAADNRVILDKIYDLGYIQEKTQKQDKILDDLSGTWVGIDNLRIVNSKKVTQRPFSSVEPVATATNNLKTENIYQLAWHTDFIFKISEIQKTGKYQITIMKEGSRYYSESIIDKTVNIVPQKDNSFNFTIADAQVYTPNQGGYSVARFGAGMLGNLTGMNWLGDAANVAVDATQSNDLPSNTQTAYIFALKYRDGKLEGLVNVVQKFSNPNQQRTTKNELYEITFVKKDNDSVFFNEIRKSIENKPDIISLNQKLYIDKWGNTLSNQEIENKLTNVNPEWAKSYKKMRNQRTTGLALTWTGAAIACISMPIFITGMTNEDKKLATIGGICFGIGFFSYVAGFPLWTPAKKKCEKIINEYNNEVNLHPKNKPTSQLHFGVSTSGGIGLIFKF